MSRASFVAKDVRREDPNDIYSDIDFKVAIGSSGDCFERYVLRMEELRQSARIILQAINLITTGPVKQPNNKLSAPSRLELKLEMEALIHHFKSFTEGCRIPANTAYASVEAPKGEFGVSLAYNGARNTYRCKIKAPGFSHLHGLDFMTRGHLLADVVAAIGTQDIVFGEVDR